MKKFLRRMIVAFLVIIVAVTGVIQVMATETTAQKNLGEVVDSYEGLGGSFTLNTSSRFFVVSDSEPTGELLQTVQLVQQQFAADSRPSATPLEIVWGPESWAKTGDIVVKLDTNASMLAEAYTITAKDVATVVASDVDGLLYGLNMLQQYFRAVGSNTLYGFTASDSPDTVERTVMLDCGRKYYTKEWICNFIRQISWMGYNTFELHFSEDGGFRADFWDSDYYTDNYNPENDFSWICGSKIQSWVGDDYSTDPCANKYLTTKEIIEILNVAKEYHLEVIPSFDSPSHMDYLTWKFEQNYKSNNNYSFKYNGKTYTAKSVKGCINYTGKTGESYLRWPYYSTIDITDGTVAKAFVFQLYSDIADFFKEYAGSTKFNIGADEVNLNTNNLSSGYSFKWSYNEFPEYVNDLNSLLKSKGYTTRIFNDFIGTTKYTSDTKFDSDIEILYWLSPFDPNTGNQNSDETEPVSYFVNENRIIYNVIQTNCYYPSRVADGLSSSSPYYMMDARNPDNRNWTMYHSTEKDIYNEWYPADISEHGDYSEDVEDVPSSQLGGGYFCVWNDYPSLNTEKEIWEGVYDNTGTSNYFYSMFDRMWSNAIKMWNWDINSSVTFSKYETIRDKFGYFPGYTSCSSSASMSEVTAPTQAYLADHTELEELLENKISQGKYTAESYAVYEEAYENATKVNSRYDATEEEITVQITTLNNAIEQLEVSDVTLKVICQSNTGEELKTIDVKTKDSFRVYVSPMTGYEFVSISGATYEPLASNDGSGYVNGKISSTDELKIVTLTYNYIPNVNRLNELISNEITDLSIYTAESKAVYSEALANAKALDVTTTTAQSQIDAIVKDLVEAQTKLTIFSTETSILSIEKLTETARLGKQVGLKITTTPDVSALTIDNEVLNLCVGKVQTLSTGETVKIWLVNFDADVVGDFIYNVNATGTQEVISSVEVTVK